jgi:hypothetical protein
VSDVLGSEAEDLTISRIMAGIVQPWALICQCLPTAKGTNPLKVKLFGAAAHLLIVLVEFSYLLDQSRQVCHRPWFLLLVLGIWGGGGRKLVHPQRCIVHFYHDPPLLGTLPIALEDILKILISTVPT